MAQNEFWQGNKAIAMGAIAAGCRFFGGYPITPSTEIMETMSEELPKLGGKFMQMEDEIGGIASAIGASIAGKKAMTASSGQVYLSNRSFWVTPTLLKFQSC